MTGSPRAATVVGSGPNGLTAAILLARAGFNVTVLEAQSTIGGGARSAALTLPGFVHDLGSAVHPLTLGSPILRTFPLAAHGLEWIQPPIPLAHPQDDGTAIALHRSVDETAAGLGPDGSTWRRILQPLASRWNDLAPDLLGGLHFPSHPFLTARFGLFAPWPASLVARTLFRTALARALFAGLAAHSTLPLERAPSAAFGWVLALTAHALGWPIPRGGAQHITNALAGYFVSLGGRILTGSPVRSLDELSPDGPILLDITPRQFLALAGTRLSDSFRHRLQRYRYGPGAFKLDFALSGPIPWTAESCSQAGTVHLGASFEEIAASERDAFHGVASSRPFVLLSQPSRFDLTRAPANQHTVWAYCHVPNGSPDLSLAGMADRVQAQIERFAPGFHARILARAVSTPTDLERQNGNLIGGDINGGVQDLSQLFFRPTAMTYRTPLRNVYLCSSSTPPGGGVHGMCGYHAVQVALAKQ